MLYRGHVIACDFCDKIVKALKVSYTVVSNFVTDMGYARAAAELSRQGFFEEAKYLMLSRHNVDVKKEVV
jgi:hypothetical protein